MSCRARLPLLCEAEERAGERRRLARRNKKPLSPALSPLVPREERESERAGRSRARSRRREEADSMDAQTGPPPHVGGYFLNGRSAHDFFSTVSRCAHP